MINSSNISSNNYNFTNSTQADGSRCFNYLPARNNSSVAKMVASPNFSSFLNASSSVVSLSANKQLQQPQKQHQEQSDSLQSSTPSISAKTTNSILTIENKNHIIDNQNENVIGGVHKNLGINNNDVINQSVTVENVAINVNNNNSKIGFNGTIQGSVVENSFYNNENNSINSNFINNNYFNYVYSLPVVGDKEGLMMCSVIAPFLNNIPCYELIGNSTHVVVVDEEAPLNIPFIAAQETRVGTYFLWSVPNRKYTGTLTMTEYLKVLIYCEKNPSQIESIRQLTVKEWRELSSEKNKKDNKKNTRDSITSAVCEETNSANSDNNSNKDVGEESDENKENDSENDPGYGNSNKLICATPDEPLSVCITKMIKANVRRLAIVADDANAEASIIGVITYTLIIEYLANHLFKLPSFAPYFPSFTNDATSPSDLNSNASDSNFPSYITSPSNTNNNNLAIANNNSLLGQSNTIGLNSSSNENISNHQFTSNGQQMSQRLNQNQNALETSANQQQKNLVSFGCSSSSNNTSNVTSNVASFSKCPFTLSNNNITSPPINTPAVEATSCNLSSYYRSIFDVPFCKLPSLGKINQYKASDKDNKYPSPAYLTLDSSFSEAVQALLQNCAHTMPIVNPETMEIIDVLRRSDVMHVDPSVVYVNFNNFNLSNSSNLNNNNASTCSNNNINIKLPTVQDILLLSKKYLYSSLTSPRESVSSTPRVISGNIINNNNNALNVNSSGGNPFVNSAVAASTSSASSVASAMTGVNSTYVPGTSTPIFYETDSLRDIINHFANRNVDVLFLVDEKTGALIGQLSTSEVLYFFANYCCKNDSILPQQQS